ncbi:MAG: protein-disulfide isomerase [Gammaproteobacteria bacterium]|nr:protein-disulfide isomerase [Gammaproteobacteria bacterium]MAY02026.1 protein-disulfide isomerase [Gammaproteobacteria bacterium]|tara:strand:- start:336 stop:989 length:654 start_codon:yes stop_codon:yes gene_type:complete
MTVKLHLIADPLCGWCFAAAPLLSASREIPGLDIVLHCGGLFAGSNRQQVDASMRNYIESHHERITQLSGQHVGAGFDALLNSGTAILDSTPPIRAILSVIEIDGDPVVYYQALVKAHFIDGRPVAEPETLIDIAKQCGLDSTSFSEAYASLDESQVSQHISNSRRLLQQLGGQGFPTFGLEHDGQMQILNHHSLYGDPQAWLEALQKLVSEKNPVH